METRKAILAVSFGTSYKENIEKTIGAVERQIAALCPDIPLFRAFTSPTIRRKLWEKEGILVESPEAMLQHLLEDGYTDVVVQPTFMIPGYEYDKLEQTVARAQSAFSHLVFGRPALWEDADVAEIGEFLKTIAKEDTWVFMGHGTEHAADAIYQKLQAYLDRTGEGNIFIGTAEGELGMDAVLKKIQERETQRTETREAETKKTIVLHPLLLVAGDHANHDMAGEKPDSWKSRFESAGYSVTCVLKGLGEYAWIQERFAEQAKRGAEKRIISQK